MKKLIFWITCLSITGSVFSQEYITPNHPDYAARKAAGTLVQPPPGFYKVSQQGAAKTIQPLGLPSDAIINQKSARGGSDPVDCNCFQTLDSTYSVAPFTSGIEPDYRNDDGSTDAIDIPFEFCLYGDSYTSLYINNNGNISFGNSVGTFSSDPFPNNFLMVAPFWADVDTRNGASGLVHFKIAQHYMVVIWDNVGYYSSAADKRNSFQLIITDGTTPIVPFGFNVGFCFGDMQWTTGSASDGVNGFGGIAATTGANRGNNVNYVQFGQFDHPGADYDGPFGQPDGVSWLDNKTFFFNTCTDDGSANVPPVPIQSDICAPANLCVGQSVPFNITFFAVEPEQSCSTIVTPAGLEGLVITSNVPGNFNTISGTFTATADNVGMNEVVFTCSDDGVPAGVTQISAFFNVVQNNFIVPVLGNDSICEASCTELSVGVFDTYLWSTGAATPSIQVCETGGPYTVDLTVGGCSGTSLPFTIFPGVAQIPVITGPDSACVGNTVTISTAPQFATYTWTGAPNASFNSANVGPGTYILTTVDLNGCTASDTFTVELGLGVNPIITADDDTICQGFTAQLNGSSGFTSYEWTGASFGNLQTITGGPGTYFLQTTDQSGCGGRDTFTVVELQLAPPIIIGDDSSCVENTVTLQVIGDYETYSWLGISVDTSFAIVPPGTYVVTVSDSTGCEGTSAPFTVTPFPVLQPIITGNDHYCFNELTTLSTSLGLLTYIWSPGGATTDSITVPAGNYTVSGIDSNGCETQTSQPFTVTSSSPEADIIGIETFCQYDSLLLTTAGGPDFFQTYLWISLNDTLSTNDSLTYYGAPSPLTLEVTDNFGCVDTFTTVIEYIDKPVAGFIANPNSPSVMVNTEINYTSTSTAGAGDNLIQWLWIFNPPNDSTYFENPSYVWESPDTGQKVITLIVTSQFGCKDTVTSPVYIIDKPFVPNVFSPNGDGFNETLKIPFLGNYPGNTVVIFNRWGTKVFEGQDYKDDWKGENLPSGTYFYVVSAPGLAPPLKGSVTLLRN